jgi:type VI secretion system protein ImpE
MDASQLFKAGQLAEAIETQLAIVKAKPLDHGQRLFLFEMLVFNGELDRAQRQIEAIQHDEPELVAAVSDYRRMLDSERLRRQVFSGKAKPDFLSPPPEHVRQRLIGIAKLAESSSEAQEIFQQANEQIPAIQGSLNGTPFDLLRDGDDRLGSVLEVHVKGKYLWIPLEQVRKITLTAPRFPRDLIWMPAHLEVIEGDEGSFCLRFIPVPKWKPIRKLNLAA